MADQKSRAISRIVGGELDFPGSPPPAHFYAVASTERSGSTLFCSNLWQTGLLGAPTEYFNFHHMMFHMASRIGAAGCEDYVRRLFACRTSPNRVFGVKLHWPHLQFLILANLIRHFSSARWILFERRDTVAQAVSFAKAIQTGRWTSLSEPQAPPAYDFRTLRNCHRQILMHRKEWRDFLGDARRQPLVFQFEDFLAAPEEGVGAVVKWLNCPQAPRAAITLPRLERLGDETNAEWAERFRRDAARAGYRI